MKKVIHLWQLGSHKALLLPFCSSYLVQFTDEMKDILFYFGLNDRTIESLPAELTEGVTEGGIWTGCLGASGLVTNTFLFTFP